MRDDLGTTIQNAHLDDLIQPEFHVPLPLPPGSLDDGGPQQAPVIEVSESDGAFHVYADFRSVLQDSGADIGVEFAQQGMTLTSGKVQRYLPIPTDAQTEHARVIIDGGIVRMSVPTADLGHRWRSIVMW